jgi:hypothetical protein
VGEELFSILYPRIIKLSFSFTVCLPIDFLNQTRHRHIVLFESPATTHFFIKLSSRLKCNSIGVVYLYGIFFLMKSAEDFCFKANFHEEYENYFFSILTAASTFAVKSNEMFSVRYYFASIFLVL